MNNNTLKKLIKEEIRSILNEGDHEQQNYMFFQNLHTIKRMVEKMLTLNPQEVDSLLSNGHAWAVDHISTSADDVGEVETWLCNELSHEMNNTNMMSEANLGHNEEYSIEPEGRFWIVTYKTMDGKKEKSFDSEKQARAFANTLK